MWKRKLDKWLVNSNEEKLVVGERTPYWIDSMKQDLKRWDLPVTLKVENPVLVQNRVPVSFVRNNPVK